MGLVSTSSPSYRALYSPISDLKKYSRGPDHEHSVAFSLSQETQYTSGFDRRELSPKQTTPRRGNELHFGQVGLHHIDSDFFVTLSGHGLRRPCRLDPQQSIHSGSTEK